MCTFFTLRIYGFQNLSWTFYFAFFNRRYWLQCLLYHSYWSWWHSTSLSPKFRKFLKWIWFIHCNFWRREFQILSWLYRHYLMFTYEINIVLENRLRYLLFASQISPSVFKNRVSNLDFHVTVEWPTDKLNITQKLLVFDRVGTYHLNYFGNGGLIFAVIKL